MNWIGSNIPCLGNSIFVRGNSRFTADLPATRVVRSPYAAGQLNSFSET